MGISLDNTSVNMGCNNSIKKRVEEMNAAVAVIGCPCHIVHNIASKAGEAYDKVHACILNESVYILQVTKSFCVGDRVQC